MPGPVFPQPIRTERLDLAAIGADALEAWCRRDTESLESLTGARFEPATSAPPLFDEELAELHELFRDDPEGAGWIWLAVDRRAGVPVGMVGASPVEEAVLTIGYSVYPDFEGQGFATEAVRAILAWSLARPDVRTLRATIPAWNIPSIRVAENVGMVRTATARDPEAGEVLVYERRAEAGAPPAG